MGCILDSVSHHQVSQGTSCDNNFTPLGTSLISSPLLLHVTLSPPAVFFMPCVDVVAKMRPLPIRKKFLMQRRMHMSDEGAGGTESRC